MDATRLYHTLYGYRRNDNVSIERIEAEDPDAYSILVDMIAQDHVYEPGESAVSITKAQKLCNYYEKGPTESFVQDVLKSMKSETLKLASAPLTPNAAVGYVCVCVCASVCMCMCVLLSCLLT
jgi:hypothetical protein